MINPNEIISGKYLKVSRSWAKAVFGSIATIDMCILLKWSHYTIYYMHKLPKLDEFRTENCLKRLSCYHHAVHDCEYDLATALVGYDLL